MKELNKKFILTHLNLAAKQLMLSKNILDIENYEKQTKSKIEYYLNNSLVDKVYEEEFKLLVYYELKSYKKQIQKIQSEEKSEYIVASYLQIKKESIGLEVYINESIEAFSNLSVQVSEGLIKEIKIKHVETLLKKELLTLIKEKINKRSENILKLLQILD